MTHSPPARRRARRLGGVLAGTLALGLVPLAGPASAATPLPEQRNIRENSCPAEPPTGTITSTDVPEDGFTDVATGNVHEFAVDCVRWYKVTSGLTASTYGPAGSVRRDQMATFIAQMIDYVTDRTGATGLGDAPAGNQFPCDVDTGNVHFANIQRLAANDVVSGSGSSSAGACFDPDGTVTRGQMATFIREASRVAGVTIPPVGDEDYFVDDETSSHEGNINAIAKVGLAAGAGTNTNNDAIYKPDDVVRRDQMASFITTTLDSLVEGEDIQPPTVSVGFDPSANAVPKDGPLEVTVTGVRGDVESATAKGCGASAVTEEANPAVIVLTIPASQPNGDCTITVDTTFVDEAADVFGGQDRERSDEYEVTIVNA